jgi:hypothetical protein
MLHLEVGKLLSLLMRRKSAAVMRVRCFGLPMVGVSLHKGGLLIRVIQSTFCFYRIYMLPNTCYSGHLNY